MRVQSPASLVIVGGVKGTVRVIPSYEKQKLSVVEASDIALIVANGLVHQLSSSNRLI